jgi:hypothetical protein
MEGIMEKNDIVNQLLKLIEDQTEILRYSYSMNGIKVNLKCQDETIADEVHSYLFRNITSSQSISANVTWEVVCISSSINKVDEDIGEKLVIHYNSVPTYGYVLSQTMDNKYIYNERYKTYVLVNKTKRKIYIIGQKENGYLYPKRISYIAAEVYNVIRSVLQIEMENKGAIILHGSSMTINNKGIVFLGSKGSGKTTSLIASVLKRVVSYMSNDRVFVYSENNKVKINGWPSTCRITMDAVNLFQNYLHLKR